MITKQERNFVSKVKPLLTKYEPSNNNQIAELLEKLPKPVTHWRMLVFCRALQNLTYANESPEEHGELENARKYMANIYKYGLMQPPLF